ncbi:S8 family serine peptidase, partial [Paenibacillus apiarius]
LIRSPAAGLYLPFLAHGRNSGISVSSLDDDLNISYFSTVNSRVDFYMLGEDIQSLGGEISKIESYSGTSFAVPFITALIILTKAENPSLGPEELEELLKQKTISYQSFWKYQKKMWK